MRILIVESDGKSAASLVMLLKKQYGVDVVKDGENCLRCLDTHVYDGFILSKSLADLDGIAVLRRLREKTSAPLMMLADKAEPSEIVAGLDAGADDYMVRPFDAAVFMARVRAITRRKGDIEREILAYEDLTLVRETATLYRGEEYVRLGTKEYQLAELLLREAGHVVRKETIQKSIWGWDGDSEYNSVEVYISFLRRKLAALNTKTKITTIRGIGYCLCSGKL